MAGLGALDNLLSLGRELFGSAARGNPKISELAELSGVAMDKLEDASPEALAAVLDRAARQRLIDPRSANSIKIQIAKDTQEAVPASSSDFFEAMGDEGALTEFSGIGNLIDTYVYENSQQALKDAMSDPDYNVYLDVLKTNLNKTFPSGKIRVRRAENYLTKRPEENLSNEYKTINAKDISFASNISENEVIVKEGDKFTSYFIDNALPKDAQPALPRLRVDNPGGDWLAGKLRRALEKRQSANPNTYESTLGSGEGVTGYFKEPIRLNPNMLSNIAGSVGEEAYRPDPEKMRRLRESIAESGYEESPILIQVREDGVPFVVEGNHRIIEGVESGRPTIPVEIKYLRGAEDVDGPLSPVALGVPR